MSNHDPVVAHRDLAWSREEMCELFNERVLPLVRPGEHITDLKRKWTAYKPGKECLVLYWIWFGDRKRDPYQIASATFGRPERLEKLYERHYAGGAGEPNGSSATAVLLPDYPCLVEIFPNDWKLPMLARANDPAAVASLMTTADAGAGPRVTNIDVMRYRPHRRCVLGYELEWPDGAGPDSVIGKVYPVGPKAGDVRRKLIALGEQGRAAGLRFPEPVATSEDSTLLLMERVPGTNMAELLEDTTTESAAKSVIGGALRALTRFHAMRLESEASRTIPTEFVQLRKRTERLRNAVAELAGEAEALLDTLEPLVRDYGDGPSSLIHGDFKPSQLLVDGDGIALVDLDRACHGDPAIDVGNFMAVLQKAELIQGLAHARALPEWFLEQYQELTGNTAVAEGARLFEAIALVRMIVRKFERSPHKYFRYGRNWDACQLLDQVAQRLPALNGGART